MSSNNIEFEEFRWIGSKTPSKAKNIFLYESFVSNGITYFKGDYVLIRNEDCVDPEDIFNCYIARIETLYEKVGKEEPYQAEVKWFSRIADLPLHSRNTINPISDYEVVEDNRSHWSKIVDAETIFGKCEVVYLSLSDKAPQTNSDDESAVFFCRYKFKQNKLKPVDEECVKKCNTPSIKGLQEKEKRYCAISTGSPQFPKVLIKRIDDRVLESENIRILVAKPDAKSIEDVTNNLNELMLLSPSKMLTRKRPHIHSLTSIPFVKSPRKESMSHRFIDSYDSDEDQKNMYCDLGRKNVPQKLVGNKSPHRSSKRLQNCTPSKSECMKTDIMCPSPNKISKTYPPIAKLNISSPSSSRISKIPQQHINSNISSPSCNNITDAFHQNIRTNISSLSPKTLTKSSQTIVKDISSSVPNKILKTPRRLDFSEDTDYSVTRSGRKVKSVVYTEKNIFDEEFKKSAISSVSKKLGKFIRNNYSDDSESGSAFSASEDSSCESDESMLECFSSDLNGQPLHKKKKRLKSNKMLIKEKSLSIPYRKTPLKKPKNVLEESRLRLHVSAVPKSLPCREEEYCDIYNFVKGCLSSQTGGCMYISGVPGTGKTAAVHEVIRNLEEEKESGEVPLFTFVEVNGMRMTDPYQCYVHIFKSLTGKTIASQQAATLLEKRFAENGPKRDAVILLVDELDRLWTRKQTVLYNIFDWPSKKHSKLIVLAIANTMDLPERLMMNRISSRLGLTRKTFQPYNFKQLQEIILSRIQELQVFDSDAVQFVSRKVAAVSGDARRALDICRHATEVAERTKATPKKKSKILVGMEHVDTAIQEMFSSPVISFIRCSSKLEKLFFQCILADFNRTGLEETNLLKVSEHLSSSCRFEGLIAPNTTQIRNICSRLVHSHLILVDNFRNGQYMKIRLNASPDDVNYALTGRTL